MWRAIRVQALSGFRLEVEFEDGVHGIVDLTSDLRGPMFEPLRDPARFAEVGLDEDGVVCWPNGADLAPDALYEDLKSAHSASS
jgi:hypothetical protein